MKTIITVLFIGASFYIQAQNLNQSLVVQTNLSNLNFNQSNRNINVMDNNVGNNDNNVQLRVNDRGGRGNTSIARNRGRGIQIQQNVNPVEDQQVYAQTNNKQEKVTNEESNVNVSIQAPNINVDMPQININVPKVNLNLTTSKTKEKEVEKRTPKRLDDFRIKTSGGSGTASSHHTSHKKSSFGKKIKKATRCWWKKHFSGEIKFKVSCECFTF